MSLSVAGKVAIVTGAGRGIGRAIARHFAISGAHVMLADGDDASMAAVLREGSACKGSLRSFHADMGTRLGVSNLVSATLDAFDRVDVLVNAHAVFTLGPPLDPELLDEMLNQNVVAGTRLSQIVAGRMIAQADDASAAGQPPAEAAGCIINVSAMTQRLPHPEVMAYSVACAAQDQATRALALALAPHRIRVNGIAHASVLSMRMQADLAQDPALRETVLSGTPLGRIAGAEEVAETAQFLASDAARFITGQIVAVDGGRSLMDRVTVPAY